MKYTVGPHFKSMNLRYIMTISQIVYNESIMAQCLFLFQYRNIDLDHDLIREIRQNPRKVLCLVVGTAEASTGGTLHSYGAVKAKGAIKLEQPIQQVM